MAFTYVTVTLDVDVPGGTIPRGSLTLTPAETMTNGAKMVPPTSYEGTLDDVGSISIPLVPANTDPDTSPEGSYYVALLKVGKASREWRVIVPHDQGATVDLATLVPLSTPAVSGAQPADVDLTALAALGDGFPRREAGTWAARTAAQFRDDIDAASDTASVARRVLAGSARVYDATQVHPSPPTVTLSSANAATTITSGVLVPLARASSTLIDTVNDPHYEHLSVVQGKLDVSSTSRGFPNYLTGGTAQAARHRVRYRFHYHGQALEAHFRQRATSFIYRVWVDGLPIAADFTTAAVTASATYLLKLDFGSTGSRVVELEVLDPEFGGVWIEPTATLTRTRLSRPTLMAIGDSVTAGANGVVAGGTWLSHAARMLRCDQINLGIGGTGYLTSGTQFRDRITPDAVPQNPDVLVVFGGYNDTAQTQQAVQDEATYVLGQLRTQLPNTLIIAVGCWLLGHAPTTAMLNTDAAIKAAATASEVPFISLIDPLQRSGTAPAWATATAYGVGDMVVANGVVWKCMTSHTSPGSFATTNWRATTFVTGTGRVGATAGNGNADVIISSDGTHPTAEGHRALGYHFAQEITRKLREIAVGS